MFAGAPELRKGTLSENSLATTCDEMMGERKFGICPDLEQH
jgi:hypothetical protein